MNINNVDTIIDDLRKSGSNIDKLEEFRNDITTKLKKDRSLEETLNEIVDRIKEQTEEFLHRKNDFGTNLISGISSCIYMPDFNNNGEFKIKLIGGSRSRNLDLKIDENTMFDVASITKLYTLLLLFKLEEANIIDLNTKISDLNPDFQNLEDFTLNDLVRMHGELRTDGNVARASSEKEAYNILHTLYLNSNSRSEGKYTDFGAIVIGDTIAKLVSKELGREMSFNDVMNEFLIKPLKLDHTQFNPTNDNLSGNNGLKVHDPKARILGGALGHAGIFTTSDDLARLSHEIFSLGYIGKNNVKRLGEITFPGSNKGNLGIYVKHPLGYSKTFTPLEFSKGSFSHQGWTGSMAAFDPNNYIHNNILVNSIFHDSNPDLVKSDKPVGFMSAFEEYQAGITRNIMLMYVAKKYYNKYCNVKENIDKTKFIK